MTDWLLSIIAVELAFIAGYLWAIRDKVARDGRRHCQTCAKVYAAGYRERNAEAIRKHDREGWRARRDADVLLELANS